MITDTLAIFIIIIICVYYFLYTYHMDVTIYLSDAPVTPIIPRDYWLNSIPELELLEKNWKVILNEYKSIQKSTTSIKGDMFFKEIIKDDKWKKFYIKWYSDIKPNIRKQLPQTCKILDMCPSIQLAMFSIMTPGSVVTPHKGPYNGALRGHLGLQCPSKSDGCAIKINGCEYGWNNGKLIVWDDTFTHSVRNDSQSDRVILFVDISRPLKPGLLSTCLKKCGHFVESFTARDN